MPSVCRVDFILLSCLVHLKFQLIRTLKRKKRIVNCQLCTYDLEIMSWLAKNIIRDSNYLGNPLYYKHTEIPKEQAERGDYFYECAVL